MMEENLKRAILMDHYQNPRNKGLSDDPLYKEVHMASDSCIDDIKVQMYIVDDQIKDVRFDGVGCTISFASTSIMSEMLIDLKRDEAMHLIEEYYHMVDEKEYDVDLLEEANAFDTLYKQANRIKCGTIGIKAMEQLIKESYEYEK